MKYLLDTQILLWALIAPEQLPAAIRKVLEDDKSRIWFSLASIWEIAIKHSLAKEEFRVAPSMIWEAARGTLFTELAMEPLHILRVASLPWLHKDPFDRMLVAQAMASGMTLLTVDKVIPRYFER